MAMESGHRGDEQRQHVDQRMGPVQIETLAVPLAGCRGMNSQWQREREREEGEEREERDYAPLWRGINISREIDR
jgi:hypothetical protein